jgi:hypothetical protein
MTQSRPARLDDPDEHYPYKHEHVRRLVTENKRFGPNGPGDDSVETTDVLSPAIVEATAAYVAAQATFVASQSSEDRAAYRARRDELTAARRAHRVNRLDDQGRPVHAIIGIRSGVAETFKGVS